MTENAKKSESARIAAGWLDALMPSLVSLVTTGAILFAASQYSWFGAEPASPPSKGVLVFSLDSWIKDLPAGASKEEMDAHFQQARAAADRAAEAGYVVLDGSRVIASPATKRLVPGMFPAKNHGGSDAAN